MDLVQFIMKAETAFSGTTSCTILSALFSLLYKPSITLPVLRFVDLSKQLSAAQ